jgi:hypothetical protein
MHAMPVLSPRRLAVRRVLPEIAIRKGPRNIVAHDCHALEPAPAVIN